ncbi:hypothetical protein LX36DRAFT_658534 [Colletotrichum falcatum]|nr:hypothetical protein LX36DRAFT_658534 [Colletotrichum falcatum]
MSPTTVSKRSFSIEIPSTPSNASKSLSLRTLWSGTHSSLTRLLRAKIRGRPLSQGKSSASGSESPVRFEISLPRHPERPIPPYFPKDILVAIVCPPVAVYRVDRGLNARVWLTVALTLLGWLPGVACKCGWEGRGFKVWEMSADRWGGEGEPTDALLTVPARPESPYYWHTAERSSSIETGPSRRVRKKHGKQG